MSASKCPITDHIVQIATKKRRSFTIADKFKIIERLEGGASIKDLCNDLNMRQSTLSTIWKSREQVKDLYRKDVTRNRKMKSSQHKDIEDALIEWYNSKKGQKIHINGPVLKGKANEFGKMLKKNNFDCSTSWISRFRKRHNISLEKVCMKEEVGELEERDEEPLINVPRISQVYSCEKIVEQNNSIKEESIEILDNEDSATTIEPERDDNFQECARYVEDDVSSTSDLFGTRCDNSSQGVYTLFGKYVSASLLRLPPENRLAAEGAIFQVLFKEKMKAFGKIKEVETI